MSYYEALLLLFYIYFQTATFFSLIGVSGGAESVGSPELLLPQLLLSNDGQRQRRRRRTANRELHKIHFLLLMWDVKL
jgi:hypothetical protein